MLVQMSLWIYLMLFAICLATLFFLALKPNKRNITRAFKLGLILVVIDLLFQHFGWYANLWTITGSVFPIGIVPIEVIIIAFCAGFTYALLFKPKFNPSLAITSSLLISLIGIAIEAMLIKASLLIYLKVTSWHALLAYFIAFLGISKINSML